jgi:hypothetical protein
MQRLTLNIPAAGYVAGDAFRVYANVDAAGRATAAVDRLISGTSAVPFFPLGSAADPDLVREVSTPRLYFGRYRFEVRTSDALGNETAAVREFQTMVNSGPDRAQDVRHSSTVDGRPGFSFTAPAQMRA